MIDIFFLCETDDNSLNRQHLYLAGSESKESLKYQSIGMRSMLIQSYNCGLYESPKECVLFWVSSYL